MGSVWIEVGIAVPLDAPPIDWDRHRGAVRAMSPDDVARLDVNASLDPHQLLAAMDIIEAGIASGAIRRSEHDDWVLYGARGESWGDAPSDECWALETLEFAPGLPLADGGFRLWGRSWNPGEAIPEIRI